MSAWRPPALCRTPLARFVAPRGAPPAPSLSQRAAYEGHPALLVAAYGWVLRRATDALGASRGFRGPLGAPGGLRGGPIRSSSIFNIFSSVFHRRFCRGFSVAFGDYRRVRGLPEAPGGPRPSVRSRRHKTYATASFFDVFGLRRPTPRPGTVENYSGRNASPGDVVETSWGPRCEQNATLGERVAAAVVAVVEG